MGDGGAPATVRNDWVTVTGRVLSVGKTIVGDGGGGEGDVTGGVSGSVVVDCEVWI